ncbi:MAG: M48 family metallopeptidase [Marinilabiliaceae bacterium]|nr:M48 family metallopeptidase [Marinilabiliaceae bacterium]
MESQSNNYLVSQKERVYFVVRLFFSLVIYLGLGFSLFNDEASELIPLNQVIATIIGLIILTFIIYIIRNGAFIGLIKSFSVKITERQLPEIYQMTEKISNGLKIKKMPNVYLLQEGGLLNAFAKKYFNANYIVIYSDLLEAYYEGDKDAVEFVIAHEMGHIKRNHLWKDLLLAPSLFIPFLPMAYYRACELTCDNIGKYSNAKGAVNGLLVLASGKVLYRYLNVSEYLKQEYEDASFWRWLVEKTLTHPNLYKRLNNVFDGNIEASRKYVAPVKNSSKQTVPSSIKLSGMVETEKSEPAAESDHSRYWPE